jgi:hypothetical protein
LSEISHQHISHPIFSHQRFRQQKQNTINHRDDEHAFGGRIPVSVDVECKQANIGYQAPGTDECDKPAFLWQYFQKVGKGVGREPDKINKKEHDHR